MHLFCSLNASFVIQNQQFLFYLVGLKQFFDPSLQVLQKIGRKYKESKFQKRSNIAFSCAIPKPIANPTREMVRAHFNIPKS